MCSNMFANIPKTKKRKNARKKHVYEVNDFDACDINIRLTSNPILNTQMTVCYKPKDAEVETDRLTR